MQTSWKPSAETELQADSGISHGVGVSVVHGSTAGCTSTAASAWTTRNTYDGMARRSIAQFSMAPISMIVP